MAGTTEKQPIASLEEYFLKGTTSGVYELDANGTVLYSSLKSNDGSISRAYDLDGLDFFGQITRFNNSSDLQHRFERFQAEYSPSESFDFTCKYDEEDQVIRVLLARLMYGNDGNDLFLIYVVNSSPKTNSTIA